MSAFEMGVPAMCASGGESLPLSESLYGARPCPERAVLTLTGEDRHSFLQGLVTADVRQTTTGAALYTGFLSPQGKLLHDFCLVERQEQLWLEVDAARCADLERRLNQYRLRARVTLQAHGTAWSVFRVWDERQDGPKKDAVTGDGTVPVTTPVLAPVLAPDTLRQRLEKALTTANGPEAVVFTDPRPVVSASQGLGVHVLLSGDAVQGGAMLAAIGFPALPTTAGEERRICAAVPEGGRDWEAGQLLALEANLDKLGAIAWDKGCYLGQELTARTRWRGLIKRRLVPVFGQGPLPPSGTPVIIAPMGQNELAGREVGTLYSRHGAWALALLRLEALAPGQPPLEAAGVRLMPHWPPMMTSRKDTGTETEISEISVMPPSSTILPADR